MRTKGLKGWMQEASREANPVKHRWRLLVRLIQKTFKYRVVPEEVAWSTIVFLLKGRGGYLGIGIFEVVCKVCAAVVNFQLKWSVTLHNTLYMFRVGRGMGTSTLGSKLAQQLAGIFQATVLCFDGHAEGV